jgi:peptidyl-prolyl cis-trans isomerase D
MFIVHGEKIRKHARWIMAGVLLLLIPGFIALFTQTGSSNRQATHDLPSIGGKPVNPAEFQNALSNAKVLFTISSGRAPTGTPEMQDRLTQEAVVRILMLRKARELGLQVSDSEVVQAIHSQPMLHNESGQFDPDRYRRFTIYLNNLGISETHYEQILREELLRAKLEQMITAGALATPQEVNLVYAPYHERITVSLARFDVADYHEPVSVSNEEAQAFYDAHQEDFRTPAQVKVRYARFTIADSEPTIRLTDEEIAEYYDRNKQNYAGTNSVAPPPLESVKEKVRQDLLTYRADRAAADRATAFSVALVPKSGAERPDFTAVCKEYGVEPHETDFFSQFDQPVGPTASVAFVQQAFALGPDVPTSDPVPEPDGYFVLEYVDSKPSVIPSFDEVKDKVVDEIKHERIYEATVRHGQEVTAQLKQLVASGKSFADACAELKLKIETPPPLSFADEKTELPFAQRLLEASLGMPVGAVSQFIPTLTGGVVFSLQDRQAPDPATAEKDRSRWTQRILQQNQQGLLQMWINTYAREQGVDFGRRRSQPVRPEETDAGPS